MADEKKEEQFTTQEEIKVELTTPDPDPGQIVTTNRKSPIRRGLPLTETHGMTTEANRFKET
jgi:hypothetical protein